MNKNVIDDLINVNSNLIVPSYLIKFYSYLNITDYDFIVLLYFINQKDNIPFDVSKISKNLYIEESKVLEIITSLTDKKYISIEIKKNNGIIEEYISLELFYNKIKLLLIENKSVEKNSDIYSTFDGSDLYSTVEEKAANMLYLVTKNHVFIDGNKRIAATLFIYFLNYYGLLYNENGMVIDNNTLVAVTILIAQSDPKEKEVLVDLVMNFLKGE